MYHLGIVDFLQDWTLRKRLERLFKIYVTRKDPDGLSVMAPGAYQERFQSKMQQIFDLEGVGGGIGYSKESAPDSQHGQHGPKQQGGTSHQVDVVERGSALNSLVEVVHNPLNQLASSNDTIPERLSNSVIRTDEEILEV